jgi:hypothetical protein
MAYQFFIEGEKVVYTRTNTLQEHSKSHSCVTANLPPILTTGKMVVGVLLSFALSRSGAKHGKACVEQKEHDKIQQHDKDPEKHVTKI